MFRYSLRLAQAVQYVSRHEFLDALAGVCPRAASYTDSGGLPLGLAISGGVDSMALALMCREYIPENGTTLHALVVDHGLRPSSTDEATRVQRALMRDLSIETQVLPLAVKERLGTKTNVESRARAMRYQILGQACKRINITNILTAHHYDDQVETILARLVAGHNRALTGIQSISNIPECVGLHGISESGSFRPFPPSSLPPFSSVRGIEHGGIQILRPLLHFSKKRLIATCEKFGVPWFEDETNRDRTLTGRNAIRHILQNHRLPEALSGGSIIQLGKQKLSSGQMVADSVDTLFDQMPLRLDVRAGVAHTVFPKLNVSLEGISKEQINVIAQTLIRRVALLVSPVKNLLVGNFHTAAEQIFNIISDQQRPVIRPLPSRFSAGGVLFERLGRNEELIKRPETNGATRSIEWRLSSEKRASPVLGSPGNPLQSSRTIQCPPRNIRDKADLEQAFSLWDGRFWISVRNPSAYELWVRPLTQTDRASLRSLLAQGKVVLRSTGSPREWQGNDEGLDNILKEVARNNIRYTLPVIELQDSKTPDSIGLENGNGGIMSRVLAFPTLGLRVEGLMDESWPEWVKNLTWEVRYKKIDLGTKSLEDCIVGYSNPKQNTD